MSQVNYQQCDVCAKTISKGEEYIQSMLSYRRNGSSVISTYLLDEKTFSSHQRQKLRVPTSESASICNDVCVKCASKFGIRPE